MARPGIRSRPIDGGCSISASPKPRSTASRRRCWRRSTRRPMSPGPRRCRRRKSSRPRSTPMEARHGGTDLSRGGRGGDRPGDAARLLGGVPRRGRRGGGRRVQDHRRAVRGVRAGTGARHADLRTGDHRRRDGGGHDRDQADRGAHVLGFLRGLLGSGRQRDRQVALHDQRPGLVPAGDPQRQRRRRALRRPAFPVHRELGDDDPRGSRSSPRPTPPTSSGCWRLRSAIPIR